MPVRESSRYERGSAEEGAHRLLIQCDVDVDRVFGVDALEDGMDAITFTAAGNALTAFATEDTVLHVAEGWDLPAPGGAWRDRL
jgi:hypothetical protein